MSAAETRWLVRRTFQALDAYWLLCDGLPAKRYPRGKYTMEDWWYRFAAYRARLAAAVQPQERAYRLAYPRASGGGGERNR